METKQYKRKNLVDYASLFYTSIDKSPLNEIDMAIFSKLSYFHFEPFIRNKNTTQRISDLYDLSLFDTFLKRPAYKTEDRILLQAVCGNPRFKNIVIKDAKEYTNDKKEEQFSAITFLLPNNDAIIAFRGTDSTINGWKEDLNMAYKCPIPAQVDSANYLSNIAQYLNGNIYLVGHSKGGNLALFSYLSVSEDIRIKIKKIYCFDGPSFEDKYFKSFDISDLKLKLVKIVPNESIIGMIFEKEKNCKIIQSSNKLLFQHNMYNWEISLTKFKRTQKISPTARNINSSLKIWLEKCNDDEREIFIETIFKVISASGAQNIQDIAKNKDRSLLNSIVGFKNLSKERKKELASILKILVKILFSKKEKEGN